MGWAGPEKMRHGEVRQAGALTELVVCKSCSILMKDRKEVDLVGEKVGIN